ncbi:hypothetical protein QOZ80_8BG0652450 [Eleusine coracana subsp. coracana]|nr:hypothetical protein QOZ80_8BG0652450 [Eleusine coracana subsp. coracana]
MSPALQMLADAEQLNPQMKLWRDQVRELAYDIQDCVDAFMVRVDNGDGGPLGFLGLYNKFKKLIQRHEIATETEELKTRIIEISQRHKRYNFVEPTSNVARTFVDPRLPALYEEIDKLVGIKDPKKRVIELLNINNNGSSTKLKVVSLTGCGGIGKTTLAKQVYDTVKNQFSCAAFVSISRSPDVRKILRDIAIGVGCTDYPPDGHEQQLIDKLRKHIEHKRYFVVIDDVWDAEAWNFFKLALPHNDLGSRIVTTTRNTAIASSFSSQDAPLRSQRGCVQN